MIFKRLIHACRRPGLRFWASLVTAAFAPMLPDYVQAQIRTDGTMGAATTLTGPHFQIPHTLGISRR